MAAAVAKRARGRPNDPTKREALLDAARDLLLERGPDVPMETIAAKAGVAKATLYARFADRKALVEAVLRRESDRTITDEQAAESLSMDLEAALVAYGLRYMTFINARQLSGWDRLISTMAMRHPEVARRFFDLGPGRGQSHLTAIIQNGIGKGQVDTPSAAEAASDLVGLWLGFTGIEINLLARAPMSTEEISQRVIRGVGLFMCLHGASSPMPARAGLG
ncbi:MAG: TetR/AcrR family transcriptional regulator [Caulobacteraceae bacterium]